MSDNDDSIQILSAPPSVIQAVYHAATGKTENLTRYVFKNFIVRKSDLDQLYMKLKQQIDLCETLAEPTVTVKLSFTNRETQLFSSWERFNLFDSGKMELIDDIIIKIEFILKIPKTEIIQRCVINIDIDSRLSVVCSDRADLSDFEFIIIASHRIPPIMVSIDFVDYVYAKNLCQTVEDWAETLDESKNFRLAKVLSLKKFPLAFSMKAFGTVCAAAFVFMYGHLTKSDLIDTKWISFFIGMSMVMWSFSTVFVLYIGNLTASIIVKSVIPAVIILTAGDQKAYQKLKERSNNLTYTILKFILGYSAAFGVNIAASYAYAWLTRTP